MLRVTPLLVEAEPAKVRLEARLPTFTISARMHSREDYDFINSILGSIMESEECDQVLLCSVYFGRMGLKNECARRTIISKACGELQAPENCANPRRDPGDAQISLPSLGDLLQTRPVPIRSYRHLKAIRKEDQSYIESLRGIDFASSVRQL